MVKEFFTIENQAVSTIVIEKSKFICQIKSVQTDSEAKEFISSVQKEHPFATHNCYAYILTEDGRVQKFSDDKEPQGTAGMPILDCLKNRKLTDVCAVVTRYFGGIKLGTGGLARAYSQSVSSAVDNAKIVCKSLAKSYEIITDYEHYSALLKLPDEFVKITDTEFNNQIKVVFAVKIEYGDSFLSKIKDIFSGKENLRLIAEDFVSFGG